MWTVSKRLHDECKRRRAQVFELAPCEQVGRVDFERAPLHGERAFRKRLYIIFSRPERNTEKKIRSDSERVSKTAKSFTQDWISNDDVSKSNRVKRRGGEKDLFFFTSTRYIERIFFKSMLIFPPLIISFVIRIKISLWWLNKMNMCRSMKFIIKFLNLINTYVFLTRNFSYVLCKTYDDA